MVNQLAYQVIEAHFPVKITFFITNELLLSSELVNQLAYQVIEAHFPVKITFFITNELLLSSEMETHGIQLFLVRHRWKNSQFHDYRWNDSGCPPLKTPNFLVQQ